MVSRVTALRATGSLNTTSRGLKARTTSVASLGGRVRTIRGRFRSGTNALKVVKPPSRLRKVISSSLEGEALRATGSRPPSTISTVTASPLARLVIVAEMPSGNVPGLAEM